MAITQLFQKHFLRKTASPLLVLVLAGAAAANADTISNNLSNTTAGTEAAAGSTWLTASFGSGSSSSSLTNVVFYLSNPVAGIAEADLYSDGLLQPGSFVGVLTSPGNYAASLSYATFAGNGLALSANSTYWVVLKALSGEFDWAWTADNSGTGAGFQGAWGISTDAGSSWYSYAVYPTQFSVTTTAAAVTPEPGTKWLLVCGLLLSAAVFYRKQSAQGKSQRRRA